MQEHTHLASTVIFETLKINLIVCNMKNNIKNLFCLLAVFGLVTLPSCKKALEEKPYSSISPTNFYKNESDAVAAINGVYSELYTFDLFKQPLWQVSILDDDHVSGADWALGSIGAGNPQTYWAVDRPWNGFYIVVARANNILEQVPAITDINADIKQRILGEAHFLRGWAYFMLVQLYGSVPLRLKSLTLDPVPNKPRATVKELYDAVVADLQSAEQMLFPVSDSRSGEAGRVNKGVAGAFLAKTYLTMASGAVPNASITVRGGQDNGYYTQVKSSVLPGYEGIDSKSYFSMTLQKTEELINSGEYSLFDNWIDIWKKENRNKQEHIWEIQSLAGTDFTTDLHTYFDADSYVFGQGAVWMTNNHYDDYEDNDTRVLDGIYHQYIGYGPVFYPLRLAGLYSTDAAGNVYTNNGGSDQRAYIKKYNSVSDPKLENSDAFFPVIRYADVVLMAAESENEVNGPTAKAYSYLNMIRNRAKASAVPDGLTADQFRSYILEERGREFSLEGIRRYDLMRWGIYLKVMNQIGNGQDNISKVRVQKNLLLPIPLSELSSNDSLTQNPGW
jgi:hypothetical protein